MKNMDRWISTLYVEYVYVHISLDIVMQYTLIYLHVQSLIYFKWPNNKGDVHWLNVNSKSETVFYVS